MILHTVAFRTKHEAGSAAETDFLAAGMALGELPMVRNFKCYRQVSEKNDFEFALSMEFETQDEYDAYNHHPLHVDFVTNRWIPEVDDFLELDYQDYSDS
jgi:hypothetical protein